MPEKDIKKSWFKELISNIKDRFSKKLPLNDEIIESEMVQFMKDKGYTMEMVCSDMASFQEEFNKYLESKNYDVKGYKGPEEVEVDPKDKNFKLPRIRKLSEDLNVNWGFTIFSDTTTILPGLICYTVEKVEPTDKIPYTTYKPAPRVIVSVHNTGVNGGTVFITYDHKLSGKTDFNQSYKLVSEYEVIYSPLTKIHAEYICKLLNFQSKQAYKQAMIKIKKRQK